MPNKPVETAGPEAKCCLGVTYFNRALERSGKAPKCMGLAQFKHGDQDNDDVRMLNEATGDFKGVEIAITEERVPVAPTAGSDSGPSIQGGSSPTVGHGSGGVAALPPATADPSEEDRSLQARFRKQFRRNSDSLSSAVTGEKLPPLPVQIRKYDSLSEACGAFTDAATVNLLKMRVVAEFITLRTMDAAKPIWERFRSEEETE
ncbi:hypothetical protein VOLCADRAFT_89271 [Volvox carteri f. nagariensis]|uniref:Uncharacterized protein n=1 Tax=Volvox carteri f. nagariensis TaxID=3068 RepID=D8TR99_VOLCA|nr:uncharacterized protein VOLCADRAFT_89271 [Volvox carteri f. nagariensis]EFJ49853.1 hypothetical protein VOLCADRAFT_89271 [Volvox carteri f. nagariensis]|eukprot:XP_002948918.1 hypothetical protein VOLCADRAFT_89271 [Volvox carteri f. nagariensis]